MENGQKIVYKADNFFIFILISLKIYMKNEEESSVSEVFYVVSEICSGK